MGLLGVELQRIAIGAERREEAPPLLLSVAENSELRDHDGPGKDRSDEEQQQNRAARAGGLLKGIDQSAAGREAER